MSRQVFKALTAEQRRAVFRRLVALQDAGTPTLESRDIIGTKFRIPADQVRMIEDEGIEVDWPLPQLAQAA